MFYAMRGFSAQLFINLVLKKDCLFWSAGWKQTKQTKNKIERKVLLKEFWKQSSYITYTIKT